MLLRLYGSSVPLFAFQALYNEAFNFSAVKPLYVVVANLLIRTEGICPAKPIHLLRCQKKFPWWWQACMRYLAVAWQTITCLFFSKLCCSNLNWLFFSSGFALQMRNVFFPLLQYWLCQKRKAFYFIFEILKFPWPNFSQLRSSKFWNWLLYVAKKRRSPNGKESD